MTIDRIETGELPGTVLDDRYEIRDILGSGGMAVVFRAFDTQLHREVAVKVLKSDPDEPGDTERRQREARALASINHPSLVTLFDAIIRDDRSYLVMELIDGETLRDRIRSGSLTRLDMAVIACDLADGIHAVHDRGIIHRDIKPANILLAPSPHSERPFRVKLSDFGIAHFSGATRVTKPGLLLGTALYISPEQAAGRPLASSSDIYALGLTLLEGLTGKPAFSGTPLEVVAARMSRDPEIPADLGPDWVALIAQMTQRDPDKRPTALEVCHRSRVILERETRAAAPRLSPEAVTELLDVSNGESDAADDGRTRVLPVAAPQHGGDDSTTTVLPKAGAGERTSAAHAPSPPSPRSTSTTPFLQRPWALALIAAVVVAAAIALIAALSSGAGPADETVPAPTLPSLPAPLDVDVQNLLDQVQP